MEFAGKRGNKLVVRCCPDGKWYEMTCQNGSGMVSCKHTGYYSHFDYVDMSKQIEVTDRSILAELDYNMNIMLRPYKLHKLKMKLKK